MFLCTDSGAGNTIIIAELRFLLFCCALNLVYIAVQFIKNLKCLIVDKIQFVFCCSVLNHMLPKFQFTQKQVFEYTSIIYTFWRK